MKPSEVRQVLERHGLALRRDLGQNFLVDPALAERLVCGAGVEPGDRVIEIGTGLGALTRALARAGARVWTLEVDAGLVRALRAEALLPGSVELIHADVLRADLAGLARRAGPPLRVVANLPYSVSAPALRRLLDLRGLLVDASLMLQKEMAARVRAGPGSRDYGSLAVLHHLCVEVRRVLELSPESFYPRPRVRSSFLRLLPRKPALLAEGELERVERVARAAFSKRRKTLANALRGAGSQAPWAGAQVEAALARTGLPADVRAEDVTPEDFLCLTRVLVPGSAGADSRVGPRAASPREGNPRGRRTEESG